MKRFRFVCFLFLMMMSLGILCSCGNNNETQGSQDVNQQHIHEWVDATCTMPKTCSKCNETEGEALGHNLNKICTIEEDKQIFNCNDCEYQEKVDLYPSYLTENSNVKKMNAVLPGAMPCIGNARVLVLYVTFKNSSACWDKTSEDLHNYFFSEKGKADYSLAYTEEDSIRSFYYRSSYQKLDITGDVMEYTTLNDYDTYISLIDVLNEANNQLGDQIDWSDYDGNGDGYIDGIYIIPKTHWTENQNFVLHFGTNYIDDMKYSNICFFVNSQLSTGCHETCHLMGITDMYGGLGVNHGGMGIGSIMDTSGGDGDLPSPTKLVLGWLNDVTIMDYNSCGEIEVESYSYKGQTVILKPYNDENDNWFFVDYHTNEGCDYSGFEDDNPCANNGIRVMRTQMSIDDDFNIIGIGDSTGIAPSAYNYIASIRTDLNAYDTDYYLKAGDSITPYTSPSTAYSNTKVFVGNNAHLEQHLYSGISIEVISETDKTAKIKVLYDIKPVTKEYEDYLIEDCGVNTYINSLDKVELFVVKSNLELKVDSKLYLYDSENEINIELGYYQDLFSREFVIYITKEEYEKLDLSKEYYANIDGIITYYGAKLKQTNPIKVEFNTVFMPLSKEVSSSSLPINLEILEETMDIYYLEDNTVYILYYDFTNSQSYEVYALKYDLSTNTTVFNIKLDRPNNVVVNQTQVINSWNYGEYYYITFYNYSTRENYLGKYKDNELVEYLKIGEYNYYMKYDGRYVWYSGSPYIRIDCSLETMVIEESIRIPNNKFALLDIVDFSNNNALLYQDRIIFVDKQGNIVKEYEIPFDGCSFYSQDGIMYVHNYKLYVISFWPERVSVLVFDSNLECLGMNILLEQIEKYDLIPQDMYMFAFNDNIALSFTCVIKDNPARTNIVLVFDEDVNIKNYYTFIDDFRPYKCVALKNKILCIDSTGNYCYLY